MSRRLIVRDEAEADLTEAALWYEERQAGLGLELTLEVRAAIRRAVEDPFHHLLLRRQPEVGAFWPGVFPIASSSSFETMPSLSLPFSTRLVTTDIGENGYERDGLSDVYRVSGFAMRSFFPVLFTAILVNASLGAELNWPQFRGPRGDGSSPATGVPQRWSETDNIAWKVPIPGRGRSGPVVLGDRVWMTLAVEKGTRRERIGPDDMQTAEHITLEVVCLDRAEGKIQWRTKLFEVENPDPVHWFNSWATPTPVIELERLYCDFGTFGTACLNPKTGEVLWKTRLPLDHQVGPGSSPVVYEKLLVLVRDGRDAQFVAALDKETGKQFWRTERPPINASNPNLKKSFVTPLLVSSGGRTQLISPAAHWVVAYEPSTGKELWRARHGNGFSIGSCPVFGGDKVFFSTGCMKPELCAYRVDGEGDVTTTHAAWKTSKQVPVMSSPVLLGDELYWISDDGIANCADVRTGEIHWQERMNQKHLASPLLAEGRVYFFGNEGKCTVVKADKKFAKLAENNLEGTVVATPAIVDRTIFLRTDTHLYRIGKQSAASDSATAIAP